MVGGGCDGNEIQKLETDILHPLLEGTITPQADSKDTPAHPGTQPPRAPSHNHQATPAHHKTADPPSPPPQQRRKKNGRKWNGKNECEMGTGRCCRTISLRVLSPGVQSE